MAGALLQYLQFGTASLATGQGKDFPSLFLPSLCLLATDSPSLLPCLLSKFSSAQQTHRALIYASLDYTEIYHAVLKAETEAGDRTYPKASQERDDGKVWRWAEEEENMTPDECCIFEEAEESERVKIAVASIRQYCTQFQSRISKDHGPQSSRISGSIWSSEAYFTELMCLLPITVSRCPGLLTPEQLVKGLLVASGDGALLVATLANNPIIFEQGVRTLVEVLPPYSDFMDALPRSFFSETCTTSSKTIAGKCESEQCQKGFVVEKLRNCTLLCPKEVELAIRSLVKLCQISSSFAVSCRETLLSACISAELVLHITVEIVKDVLEFLSRVIFSREDTSKWMLSCFSASQKSSDRHNTSVSFPSLVGAEVSNFSDLTTFHMEPISQTDGPVQRVREGLLADAKSTWQGQGWCGRLHSHLRLFCVLVRAGDLQPTHEEVVFWLKALASTSHDLPAESHKRSKDVLMERTLQLGVSFVCLMPGLSNPATRYLFHNCVSSLLHGVKLAVSSKLTSSIELSVWIAVQLLLGNLSDIAALVREALGMHLTVHKSMMRDLVDAATSAGILSEPSSVVAAVAALRSKGPITTKRGRPDLTLSCLEQMSSQFARYGVVPAEAILHCVLVSKEPIHPVLVQLVKELADLSVPRGRLLQQNLHHSLETLLGTTSIISNRDPSGVNVCWKASKTLGSLQQLTQVPPNDGHQMTVPALTTFYIMCMEQKLRESGLDFGTGNADTTASLGAQDQEWWSSLLSSLPLKPLLVFMEERCLSYEHLLPKWLGVASALFPEQFLVPELLRNLEDSKDTLQDGLGLGEDWRWHVLTMLPPSDDMVPLDPSNTPVTSAPSDTADVDFNASRALCSLDYVTAGLEAALSDPLPAFRILHSLVDLSRLDNLKKESTLQGEWELEQMVVKKLVPLLLQPSCARCLQDEFCAWWQSLPFYALEPLVPTLLEAMKDGTMLAGVRAVGTLALELDPKRGSKKCQPATYSQLVQEPLALLACSLKLYRTPLLSVILSILQQTITKNRRICQACVSEGKIFQSGGSDLGLRREEVLAALAAQDSAVCQILLEACLLNTDVGDESNPGPLLEARRLICGTISSLLHDTPILLKLLHFQGYDPSLLPVMVEGVPTMVQCFDFLQELIQQPQQQVFAILLTAQLIIHHPKLPQSLLAAQQVITHCAHVRAKVAGSVNFLQQVLGAVADCVATFPSLAPQGVGLIQDCTVLGGPLRPSGRPRDATLYEAAISAFKKLIRKKLLHGRLPFHEANL